MPDPNRNGARQIIDGVECVFWDGYWIKRYDPPKDTMAAKKQLIDALTRRLFNHMEHGINMPGKRLNEARAAYAAEQDPQKRRVKAAMLAGALSNRAADIFKKIVELQECGVEITPDNELMRECGRCLMEALEFGKGVKHRSGDEGIDELWGEPFKAFTMPVEDFYDSRYAKIARAMTDIDNIGGAMVGCLDSGRPFRGIAALIEAFTRAARAKCETLRTDPAIFEVWPSFVVAGDELSEFQAQLPPAPSEFDQWQALEGKRLIEEGKQLLTFIARARVSMPKSTERFLSGCNRYREQCVAGARRLGELR